MSEGGPNPHSPEELPWEKIERMIGEDPEGIKAAALSDMAALLVTSKRVKRYENQEPSVQAWQAVAQDAAVRETIRTKMTNGPQAAEYGEAYRLARDIADSFAEDHYAKESGHDAVSWIDLREASQALHVDAIADNLAQDALNHIQGAPGKFTFTDPHPYPPM